MIHFDPQIFTVRFYAEGKSHENLDEFEAVLTLHKVENIAYIVAMHGKVTKEAYMQFVNECRNMGITKLSGFRKKDGDPTEWDLTKNTTNK